MTATSFGLAFVAGILSILSPCVLPVLPIVLAAAGNAHRMGPAALAGGLTLSFVGIGLFVATFGRAIGVDADIVRTAAAVLMVGVGCVLALPPLQLRLAAAGAPVGSWAGRKLNGLSPDGVGGQFGAGLLLGAAWSPCVGPTLGAASLLAAQGHSLGVVAVTMVFFGFGAGLPLVLVGLVSRRALLRWRDRLILGGGGARALFGLVLAGIGLLIVTGFDRRLETALVDASPQWLTNLTTRY